MGEQGPPGPAGDEFYAVLAADGTLNRPLGVGFSSQKLATGTYEVLFNGIDIRACGFVATVGSTEHSGSQTPGFVTVVGRAGHDDGVFVQTFDTSATPTDLPFHLAIICSAPEVD